MSTAMRVLGIDPGLARLGIAVVDGTPGALSLTHVECVETDPSDSDGNRLMQLFAAIDRSVAAFAPDVAAVERLFFATNRRTAMRVSEARGVILCALASARVTVAEYTPLQVKEAVAGHGAAGKAQLGRMTSRLLGVDAIGGPDDAADACALAVCHHHRTPLHRVAGGGAGEGRLAEAVARARVRQDRP